MSFQFRFESLLQLRRRERDEAGASVGQATEAIMKVDAQMEEIEQLRQTVKQQQSEVRTGSISVDRMLSAGRYDMQLQADVAALLDTKDKLNQEFLRRQSLLAKAQSEVGRYEKLEARAKENYRADLLRKEQAEADDRSSSSFLMKTRRLHQMAQAENEQVKR